jgi:hypothetical protein
MDTQSNQNKMSDFIGRELTWVQPHLLKSQYELRAGDVPLATLTRRSIFGSFATGESNEGCWTFKRIGFFQTRVTIRNRGRDSDIAVFKNATWSAVGTLEFPDRRRVLATTNFWQTNLEFKTEQNMLLFTFKIRGFIRSGATLIIEVPAAEMPELPWMVMLGWYLIIMMQEDDSAAAD